MAEHHHHHHHHHHHRRSRKERMARTAKIIAAICVPLLLIVILFPKQLQKLGTWISGETEELKENRHENLDYDGIDVSRYQGKIDWQRVATDTCVQFVYIKATEGYTILDSMYVSNFAGAKKAGLRVGSYHYLTSGSSVTKQFQSFSHFAKAEAQDLIPMIDVEEEGVSEWTTEQLRDSLARFVELCKAHYGKEPIIYAYARFYNDNLAPQFNDLHLFLSHYSEDEPVVLDAENKNLWQHSDKGIVDGIPNPVDLDVFATGTTLQDILLK